MMYGGLFSWGLYALFTKESATAVSETMSPLIYSIWVAIHIAAPPTLWIGQLIPNKLAGYWLQWAGDAALCLLLVTYIIGIVDYARSFQQGATYQVFVFTVLAICSFGLACRDFLLALQQEGICNGASGCQ